jgi:hypothetical protein
MSARGPWWAWLVGAAIIAAAVIVVLLTRGGGADNPSEAAEEWAEASLNGDSERVAELECEDFRGDPLAVLEVTEIVMPDRLEAKSERSTSETEWTVVLSWRDAQGEEREIPVRVRREDGDYVVC